MRKICLIFMFLSVAFGDIVDKFAQECENGDAKICTFLGLSYDTGILNNKLVGLYLRTFLKNECEKGEALDCVIYSNKFDKENIVKFREKELEILLKDCENNDSSACHSLGNRYSLYEHYFDKKLENNKNIAEEFFLKAKKLYEKECENDVAHSCLQIWELTTREMTNRDKDYGEKMLKKAHRIYEKECEQGNNKESCTQRLYNTRDEKIYDKVIYILKQNCKNGHIDSCGTLLYDGYFEDHKTNINRITEQDKEMLMKEYIRYLPISCENNNVKACFRLSRFYKQGKNIEQDIKKSEQLYIKSINLYAKECENGNRSSCMDFGYAINNKTFSEFFVPFEKNKILAKKYYAKACELGETLICKALDK